MTLEALEGTTYVTSSTADVFIRTTGDFLDLIAWGGEQGTNLCLLMDTNLPPEFYDLSTGLAGEILQKVSNYHIRLAIVGSFDMVRSERFRELMTESNKGRSVYFAHTREAALAWFIV